MDKVDKNTIPSVSVVMTTYDGLPYLQEQLDSVLHQSFDRFELIVADDDSVDATPTVLKEYAKMDLRIRILPSIGNLGLHKNLERALREAVAPLIAISDQDDIWELTKLEKLVESIGDADAVYSNSLLIDADGKSTGLTIMDRINVRKPISGAVGGIALLRKNCVSGHAMLFRRELIDAVLPFDDCMMFDQQLGYAAVTGRGLKYIDEALVFHRIHGGNQTNASLFLFDEDSSDESALGMPRAERISRSRNDLALRLEHAISRVDSQGTFRRRRIGFWLEKFVNRIRCFDSQFFDVRLFFLLLLLRRDMFYPDEVSIVKKCFKMAKGRHYYLWRDKRKS